MGRCLRNSVPPGSFESICRQTQQEAWCHEEDHRCNFCSVPIGVLYLQKYRFAGCMPNKAARTRTTPCKFRRSAARSARRRQSTTVNGSVHLGDHASATSLDSVNGSIALGAGAHVSGSASSVNGSVNINGASIVDGGILVQKPSNELLQRVRDVPRIVIGPGATVHGDLRFERTVQLFVSDKATIGTVTGATPIAFTGDAPPA
jgi:hypothetical protein